MLSPNTYHNLQYDPEGSRFGYAPAPAGSPLTSQLLGEQHWPDLTVQLFNEPLHVLPVQVEHHNSLVALELMLSGTVRVHVSIRGHTIAFVQQFGMAGLISPAHQPYQVRWNALTAEPVRTAHLFLPPSLLSRTAEAAGLNPAHVELTEGNNVHDPLLYQIGYALTQQLDSAAVPDRLFADSAKQLLVAQLLRRHCASRHELPAPGGRLPARQVQAVRDYVQANLDQAIGLEELAAVVHLSAYHFSRLFKRTTGLSPYQYVIQQRLARAVELLRATSLSVAQIAASVGYESAAHLTRLLLRHTGCRPTDYRAAR